MTTKKSGVFRRLREREFDRWWKPKKALLTAWRATYAELNAELDAEYAEASYQAGESTDDSGFYNFDYTPVSDAMAIKQDMRKE